MSHEANGLAVAIRAGDRKALARGITLVESSRPEDRAQAGELVQSLVDATGGAHRIGVTGVPETFIVDAGGRIRYRHIGPVTPEIWSTVLKPLIDALESAT